MWGERNCGVWCINLIVFYTNQLIPEPLVIDSLISWLLISSGGALFNSGAPALIDKFKKPFRIISLIKRYFIMHKNSCCTREIYKFLPLNRLRTSEASQLQSVINSGVKAGKLAAIPKISKHNSISMILFKFAALFYLINV